MAGRRVTPRQGTRLIHHLTVPLLAALANACVFLAHRRKCVHFVPQVVSCLDLGENNIGQAGAVALAAVFSSNSTLTKLSLRANSIRGGAAALAAVLANSTLRLWPLPSLCPHHSEVYCLHSLQSINCWLLTPRSLSLQSNSIGAGGAAALADALGAGEGGCLTALNQRDNRITAWGAAAIAACLRSNNALTSLNLAEVNSTDPTATQSLPMLTRGQLLCTSCSTRFHLSECPPTAVRRTELVIWVACRWPKLSR